MASDFSSGRLAMNFGIGGAKYTLHLVDRAGQSMMDLLIAFSKSMMDNAQTGLDHSLSTLLNSSQGLSTFLIPRENSDEFSQDANGLGIPYYIVNDSSIDNKYACVFGRTGDEGVIERITERFGKEKPVAQLNMQDGEPIFGKEPYRERKPVNEQVKEAKEEIRQQQNRERQAERSADDGIPRQRRSRKNDDDLDKR